MKKNVILIVDDAEVNRVALRKILKDTYHILEASDGKEALEILSEHKEQISAIVLDLIMPGMSGYDFLQLYHSSEKYKNIPVVIATVDNHPKTEEECLELGAWDFISKPYNPRVICFRIKNVIDRSQLQISKELRYRAEYDVLTDIFNKQKFFSETQELLERDTKGKYAIISIDIDKFKLINAFFGLKEGDKLLQYISGYLKDKLIGIDNVTYGRIEGDIFCACIPYEKKKEIVAFIDGIREALSEYPLDFDIVSSYGIYLVENRKQLINHMYDKASIAAKRCKGSYIKNYEFYTEDMSENIMKEQRIVNSMKLALDNEHFVLFLQPKYALNSNCLDGAEVLIRWKDPEKGMISPGEFIPVFESNGFITKLDFYVWDKTCQLIRKWLDEGKNPYPVSVNISRVSLYNPNLVSIICGLVEKYDIPTELLQLELTESAYTSNPTAILHMMEELQQKGFRILMDDFGSGYSSLNVLKDIAVDILKIDMKFLSDTDKQGRSENILASVVRMAKWLNMPVVAEGVERKEQVLFLRSIGCEYVQGYYFARPMPVEEYEALAFSGSTHFVDNIENIGGEGDDLWNSTSQMEILFSNMQQAVAIYEFEGNHVEVIRVNDAYYDLFGHQDLEHNSIKWALDEKNYATFINAFRQVEGKEEIINCELERKTELNGTIWVNVALKYVNKVGKKSVVLGTITDNTVQRELDKELKKYRAAISAVESSSDTVLIVDDIQLNRATLRSIFKNNFRVLEAENGKRAIEVLEENKYQVDIILLDLVMPEMDGLEFLAIKKENPDMSAIPVIIITAEEGKDKQIETINMGADDYVIKPFIPEVVMRRVSNVLNSNKRYREILKEFSVTHEENDVQNEQLDDLTGLLNRYTAAKMIRDELASSDKLQGMLMIGLKPDREENTKEEIAQIQKEFAQKLRKAFRKSDVVSRFIDNEFVVFMTQIPSVDFLRKRCQTIMDETAKLKDKCGQDVYCHIGAVAIENQECTVTELLGKAVDAKKKAETTKSSNYLIL